jgi:thiamine-phosphate pyrophosphorylase
MKRIQGLYAVTPDEADTAKLTAQVRAALAGGARVVQYRNKIVDAVTRLAQAQALAAACREHDALFIVNDDVALGLAVDADGVHLGREDGSIAEARAKLGRNKFLGASCYRALENAERALAEGADHVAFGSFFQSTVKPSAVRSPLSMLTEAKRRFNVPIVAIGGITPVNAPQLIEAGADALAVITALFGQPDVTAAAREFKGLFGE